MTPRTWRIAPILGVRNVRRTAEYYRDVLGFTLDPVSGVFQPNPAEREGVYGIVTREGVGVHFQVRRGPAHEEPPSRHERHVYIYVRDVDALHLELLGRGAKVVEPPRTAPYGIRELVVEDPNGYLLAFGEILP